MKTPEQLLQARLEQLLPKLSHTNLKTQKEYGRVVIEIIKRYEKYGKYNPDLVYKLACEALGVDNKRVKERKREYVIARQLCFYYIKEVSKGELSLADVGKLFHNKDHATVLHGIRVVKNHIKEDVILRQSVINFNKLLKQHEHYLCPGTILIPTL